MVEDGIGTQLANRSTTVCVIGAGYVGLTAAACLARLGHRVRCVETDPTRLSTLRTGRIPLQEPGLEILVADATRSGHLSFGSDVTAGVTGATGALLCVGTPPRPNGEPDLRQLADAAFAVACAAGPGALTLVVKSTVPPGTCEALEVIAREAAPPGTDIDVVSNPEFLREGQAVQDFFHPDRVVIGAGNERSAAVVADLYPAWWPLVHCDRRSAELVKYASNTFLAIKISFANEIAGVCETLGADAEQVLLGVGLDTRIGPAFLQPGPGFGGSCLSKDLSGLIATAGAADCEMPLAMAAEVGNHKAHRRMIETLSQTLGGLDGRRIAALGLAFKAGTDDTRDSPAIKIVDELRRAGASVATYDPLATTTEPDPDRREDPYEAVDGREAVVFLCRWPEFARIDAKRLGQRMAGHLAVDTVGIIDLEAFRSAGFEALRVGEALGAPPAPVILQPLQWALNTSLR